MELSSNNGDFASGIEDYYLASAERNLLEILKNYLLKNGYNVELRPRIGSYTIDLLAIKGEQQIAIEIKAELSSETIDQVIKTFLLINLEEGERTYEFYFATSKFAYNDSVSKIEFEELRDRLSTAGIGIFIVDLPGDLVNRVLRPRPVSPHNGVRDYFTTLEQEKRN